jgi:hypothetical protein
VRAEEGIASDLATQVTVIVVRCFSYWEMSEERAQSECGMCGVVAFDRQSHAESGSTGRTPNADEAFAQATWACKEVDDRDR